MTKLYPYWLLILLSVFLNSKLASQEDSSLSLFESDEILALTITGDFKALFSDRRGEPSYFPMKVIEYPPNQDTVVSSIRVRTRGHFRRLPGNCAYPPILLNFPQSEISALSVFRHENKMKLVMPCRGEEYVYREYLTYRLLQKLTPYSFKARLARVTFGNADGDKSTNPILGILLEDEDAMAQRIGGEIVKDGIFKPSSFTQEDFLLMASLQFLIGNTDWSTEYRQNIKIVKTDEKILAIPYDFDHSGLVYAPYAQPAEALELESVRDRRYRGYCLENPEQFQPIIDYFNKMREDVYSLYIENTMLKKGYQKSTLRFLDDFYAIINDPEDFTDTFGYPCKANNTSNVIIKGLKE